MNTEEMDATIKANASGEVEIWIGEFHIFTADESRWWHVITEDGKEIGDTPTLAEAIQLVASHQEQP